MEQMMEEDTVTLCTKCGKRPALKNRSRCQHCTDVIRKRDAERRKERLELGLCEKCGKAPADDGVKFCGSCRAKLNERSANDRAFVKKHNMCIRCRKEEAEEGRAYCLACKMDERNRGVQRRKDMPIEAVKLMDARSKEAHRRVREKRREAALCIRCGKRPPSEGKQSCMYCLDKVRRDYRMNSLAKGIIPKSDGGDGVYCAICQKTVDKYGKKLCDRCYGNILKMAEANRVKHLPDNHPWKKDNRLMYQQNMRRRQRIESSNRRQDADK